MTEARMARCFNEWMDRYIKNPNDFEREFETVAGFLKEANEGREPSYGETSAAYMAQLAKELVI